LGAGAATRETTLMEAMQAILCRLGGVPTGAERVLLWGPGNLTNELLPVPSSSLFSPFRGRCPHLRILSRTT
jgi:hypothetical protein